MHHIPPLLPHLEAIAASWLSSVGPAAVFLVTLFEGVPALGFFAPSHTVVLLAAFLAKVGVMNIWWVIAAALSGMTLGDAGGYAMGRRYGYGFLLRLGRMFSIRRQSVEKMKALVAVHLAKSIFVGKFNPLTRSLSPFVVGASKVSFVRFFFINLAANISWTALGIAVGYAFGASYSIASAYLGRIAVVGLIAAVLAVVAYRFVDKQFHIFARYELLSLIANIVALSGFVAMLQGVSGTNGFMVSPDVAVNVWFSNLSASALWLVPLATAISGIFNSIVLAVATLALAGYFLWRHKWRRMLIVIFSAGGGYVLVEWLKAIFASPRPSDALVSLIDFSFPSGHAAAAGIILVLAAYFCLPFFRSRPARGAFAAGAFLVSFFVCLSRLVLGVHWLSDVIAGYSFGIMWATGMILFVRYGGLVWTSVRDFFNPSEEAEELV